MKFFILISLLLFNLNLFAQDVYKAQYQLGFYKMENMSQIYKQTLDTIKRARSKNIVVRRQKNHEKAVIASKSVFFNLDFNKKESLFYLPDMLEDSSQSLYYIKRLTRYKGIYYTNKEKIVHSKNSYGKDFLVTIPKYKWELTKETKKIGNYNCHKAITKKYINSSRGVFEKKIIAWFSTDLPFNFGPKSYSGLPGLIIELQDGKITYTLRSLKKLQNNKISEPKKGEEITLKSFNELSKKMYQDLKRR